MKAALKEIGALKGQRNSLKRLVFSLAFIVWGGGLFAENIDIGIFESAVPGKIDIKIRPDFDIAGDETVTAILYTVRWNEPSVTISTEFIFPFFIAPQGTPEEYNGYYYQVFAAVPVNAQAMAANGEYIASTVSYTNGACARFEIIEDEWTQANNGDFYIEFLGVDVTGMIYEPFLEFGSVGGMVNGGGTISLGASTGDLTLVDYTGTINGWQHRVDEGDWNDIAFSSGLVTYSEVPAAPGLWEYRCEVQAGSCPAAYSGSAQVTVLDTVTGILPWTDQAELQIVVTSSGHTIHIRNLAAGNLAGTVKVFNLAGQKVFEKAIEAGREYSFSLHERGFLIVSFTGDSWQGMHRQKVLLD